VLFAEHAAQFVFENGEQVRVVLLALGAEFGELGVVHLRRINEPAPAGVFDVQPGSMGR
jgi:hypothetical protein